MEVWLDDAIEDQFLTAYPILKKLDIIGYLAVPTGLIGGGHLSIAKVLRKCMTLYQIRVLIKEGWVIASHGVTHPQKEYGRGFSDLTLEETEWEARVSKEWIIKNLGIEPETFVVPEHYLREEQRPVILKYYKRIREPFPLYCIHALTNNPKDAEYFNVQWFENLLRSVKECSDMVT